MAKFLLTIILSLNIVFCFAGNSGDDFYAGQFDDDVGNAKNDDVSNQEKYYYDSNNNNEQDGDYDDDDGNDNGVQYFNSDGTIDFTKFAVKFHSCSSLQKFKVKNKNANNGGDDVDDENEDEDDENNDNNNNAQSSNYQYPYNTAQVVSYRLCPVDSCKDNSWNGCRRTSGNYMISLEDYVELHQDDMTDRIEQYCDYCDQCSYMWKYFSFKCDYWYDCFTSSYNYTNLCEQEAEVVDYSQFLECTEVEVINEYYAYIADDDGDEDDYLDAENAAAYQSGYDGNNRKRRMDEAKNVYVKIYCDGSIKLGMFSDDSCSRYIGDSTAVYKATGIKGVEDDLNSGVTNSRCLSCTKEKSKYFAMDQDKYQKMQAGYYEEGERTLFDVCENLVDYSLQCNDKLDKNHKYRQHEKNCNYIDSFQKGNIDSSGHVVTKMTTMDWVVLLVFIPGGIAMLLVIAFFVYTSRTGSIDSDDADSNLVVRFSEDEPVVFT